MRNHARSAWRALRHSPASSLAAIATLALTLGIGTSIVAVVEHVAFAPPPFAELDSLFIIGHAPQDAPASNLRAVSPNTLRAWREAAASLARLEAFDPINVTITGTGYPERVSATAATESLLPLLGVAPALGRSFSAGDRNVLLLSDRFRSRLFGDGTAIGQSLVVNGEPFEIIGILPPSFDFALNHSDIWMPLRLSAEAGQRVRVVAKLNRGATAASLADAVVRSVDHREPSFIPRVMPVRTVLASPAAPAFPLLLVAAAVAVLLTTINVGSMLLLRGFDRLKDYQVRAALGARRRHLAIDSLADAHLLVGAGIGGGLLIALWATPYAARMSSTYLGAAALEIDISWLTVAVLAGVGLICAWAAGMFPMISAVRMARARFNVRGSAALSRTDVAIRRALVVSEVTAAFVLLAATLLVVRSAQLIFRVQPGLANTDVVSARLSLPGGTYAGADEVRRFYENLHLSLTNRAGDNAVAIVDELPLTGDGGRVAIRATATAPSRDSIARVASPGYFETLGIPMLGGRDFTARDNHTAPLRVVISAALARELFSTVDVVGRGVLMGATHDAAEIVGVVGDVKHRSLTEDNIPTIYFSTAQRPSRSVNIVAHPVTMTAADLLDLIRAEVAARDPQLPVYGVRTMQEVIDQSPGVAIRRVVGTALGMFGVLAIVIAAVGVFGVLAHDVRRREVELALRLALGADPGRMRRQIIVQALSLLVPALALGVLISTSLSPALRPMLFEISSSDTTTFITVATLLALLTILAASIPARRAARLQPAALLRGE